MIADELESIQYAGRVSEGAALGEGELEPAADDDDAISAVVIVPLTLVVTETGTVVRVVPLPVPVNVLDASGDEAAPLAELGDGEYTSDLDTLMRRLLLDASNAFATLDLAR